METRRVLEGSSLLAPIVGHVGDGNFHTLILVQRDDPDEIEEARRINDRIVELALSVGGTCTGEHGIGLGKLDYMRAEHGAGVDVMRFIKQALDPADLMNPGKILGEHHP